MAFTSVGKTLNLIGIDDCKFTPSGGAATDIYGIQDLKIDLAGLDQLTEGDGTVIDYISKVTHAKASLKEVTVALDSLAILLGQTVTAAGVDPNFTQTLNIGDDVCPYGVLVGTGKLVETMDALDTVASAKQVKFEIKRFRLDPNSLSINATMKNSASVDFAGICIPVTKIVFSIVSLETAT